MPFTLLTDRSLLRASGASRRYVLARIAAPKAPPRTARIPVNVGIILDRSGSMHETRKFDLARDAVEQALRMLHPEDRFSLVVYDDRVDVLAASAPATSSAIDQAIQALSRVDPRGGTDLCAGWLMGCEEVARGLDRERVTRCLLLTDGLANHGTTDRGELAHLAGQMRSRGIVTSTFGVGGDFDERLLLDMAHDGGGNAYFIEGASQIPEMLGGELGEALEVTMRDACIKVNLPSGCSAKPLNRFHHTSSRGRAETRIELGSLVSGQELDVVIELTFPAGETGEPIAGQFTLASAEDAAEERAEVRWTFASHRENDMQPRNVEVDRAVALQYVARARAEATEANRNGELDRARRVLEGTARRIAGYAGRDSVLRGLERTLREEVRVYAEEAMSPMSLKMSFYVAEAASKGRDSRGRARR